MSWRKKKEIEGPPVGGAIWEVDPVFGLNPCDRNKEKRTANDSVIQCNSGANREF